MGFLSRFYYCILVCPVFSTFAFFLDFFPQVCFTILYFITTFKLFYDNLLVFFLPLPLFFAYSPGHSRASLGQSLVGSLLLSPGSWCEEGFVCVLQESVSPVLCKFWRLYGGFIGDPFQFRPQPHPVLLHPEPLPLRQATANPYLHRRHSNTVLAQSLWVLWVVACTRFA